MPEKIAQLQEYKKARKATHPDFDDDVAKVELNAICFEWNGYELFLCIDKNGVSGVSKIEVVGNIFDNPELLEGGAGLLMHGNQLISRIDQRRN